MLTILLTLLYAICCIFLILVVLLQTGKRADLAGAFGGGGSQTALGARGAATLLTKLTTGSAVLFMVLALVLSIMTSRKSGSSGSVLDDVPAGSPAPIEAPIEVPSDSGDLGADFGSDLPPLDESDGGTATPAEGDDLTADPKPTEEP